MRFSITKLVQRLISEERGSQLAELAIIIPIMLVLFATTAEFGRYYYEYTTLAKATRLGARYLATATAAEDLSAKNLVVFGNTEGTGSPIVPGLTTANVVISRAGGVPGIPITVKVDISNFKHQPL